MTMLPSQEETDVDGPRDPDFVIVGAMKGGTTSVHRMLASHPDVYVPDGEIHCFSVDDVEEHWPWFRAPGGRWVDIDFDRHPEFYLDAHRRHFEKANPAQLLGVDSTAYLSSKNVPERLARHVPEAKVVVILRDPAMRTYSAYWHMLRGGWIDRPFEDALLREPVLLRRSRYLEHLQRFREHLAGEQIFVMCFERLIRDPSDEMGHLLRFLGLAEDTDIVDAGGAHHNAGRIPRFPALERAWNRSAGGRLAAARARGLSGSRSGPFGLQFAARVYRRLNPLVGVVPPMASSTHRWLDQYFWRTNSGLREFLDWDPEDYWFQTDGLS